MEGVGSRLGRASSRYGPAAVFSGPVRRWKKQWVRVSSSTVSYHNSNSSRSNNNGNATNNNNNYNNASALLLCRWTPISPTNTEEEPPRRKFRYTPIVVLEEPKKEAGEKHDEQHKTSRVNSLTSETRSKSDDAYENPVTEGTFVEEIQAKNKNLLTRQLSNVSHLNLDLGLKGHDENHGSDGEDKEAKSGRVRSGGIWA